MDKNYELVAKETEKAFEKVFMNRNMYPPTVPTTNVPTMVSKYLETINVPSTGPQDSVHIVNASIEAEKTVPITETPKDDSIFIDNVKITMAVTNMDLDKFEEAVISTQEAKKLCSNTPPNQQ